MTLYDTILRPILTLAGALAILLAAMGLIGCSAVSTDAAHATTNPVDTFEQDRAAILGMAGAYRVTFDFEETLALRDGYTLKPPYHAEADELVLVIQDTRDFISLQHLLVVRQGGEAHVIKHWRQDWRYQGTQGYDYAGDNTWTPVTYSDAQARGAWVQAVFQVDDSPRYWGVGRWTHHEGVSAWTAEPTHRPLPRREASKRNDYSVLSAVNTHIVTATGWVHQQDNRKLDPSDTHQPVLALEVGVNRYRKTDGQGLAKARDYWRHTAPYWAQVRNAWAEVYGRRQTIRLADRWKGDRLYTHLFDLSDLYWGEDDTRSVRPKIRRVIDAFLLSRQLAKPQDFIPICGDFRVYRVD